MAAAAAAVAAAGSTSSISTEEPVLVRYRAIAAQQLIGRICCLAYLSAADSAHLRPSS